MEEDISLEKLFFCLRRGIEVQFYPKNGMLGEY